MFFAIVGNDKHHRPEKGLKGKCPFCEEEVIAKCGLIKTHHWAHLANSNCPYKENKGEWHRQWQEKFDDNWREVLMINKENGERNIADIKTPSGFVIEFQHSAIKIEEREAREKFYKNMIWVVDAVNSKTMFKYFTAKVERNNVDDFIIYDFEYEKFATWHHSPVPVFYDLYGLEDSTEKTELQKYLYCVLPEDYFYNCSRYVMSIERNVFIKLVKDEKLKNLLNYYLKKITLEIKNNNLIKNIKIQFQISQSQYEKVNQHINEQMIIYHNIVRKKRAKVNDLKKGIKLNYQTQYKASFSQYEEIQEQLNKTNKIEFSTKQEEDKRKKINCILKTIETQNKFVNKTTEQTPPTQILINNSIKAQIKGVCDFVKHNNYTSDVFIECSKNTNLATCHDLKNCNIRNFLCCPENGITLNEYWKNIKKDTMFFTGKIKHFGKSVEFSGYPILKIADKNKKYISVLCQNYLDGKKQNNYSLLHIIYDKNCYIHYQYYATSEILIFLKNVCNNNNIKVGDINIIDEKYKNSSI